MASKNRANTRRGAIQQEKKSGWLSTASYVFAVVGLSVGLSNYDMFDKKPEDKTAKPDTVSAAFSKIPNPAPAAPVEVPWDTQGIKPYPDAPVDGETKTEDKKVSYVDGVKWNEKNGGAVRSSIKGSDDIKVTDDTEADSLAAADAELKKLRLMAKLQPAPVVKGPAKELPTERIVSEKAPIASAEPSTEAVPTTTFVQKQMQAAKSFLQSAIKTPDAGHGEKKEATLVPVLPAIKAAPTIITSNSSKLAVRPAVTALPQFMRLNNNGDHIYSVGPNIVPVSPKVIKIFTELAQQKNLPIEVFIATCARESACKPEEINKDTDACGLMQLMPTKKEQTLFRLAYTQGPAHGFPRARELVKQYVVGHDKYGNAILHYKPKNLAAAEELKKDLCLNPRFNASVWAADLKHNVRAYEAFLRGKEPTGREAVMGEIVMINNLGPGGMNKLFERVLADKKSGHDTMARDFFGEKTAKQNPSLVKFPDSKVLRADKNGKIYEVTITGRDKTVRDVYNLISEHGGWRTLSELAPSRKL